jgi:hypothetical protein
VNNYTIYRLCVVLCYNGLQLKTIVPIQGALLMEQTISFRLEAYERAELQRIANQLGVSLNRAARALIRMYLIQNALTVHTAAQPPRIDAMSTHVPHETPDNTSISG